MRPSPLASLAIACLLSGAVRGGSGPVALVDVSGDHPVTGALLDKVRAQLAAQKITLMGDQNGTASALVGPITDERTEALAFARSALAAAEADQTQFRYEIALSRLDPVQARLLSISPSAEVAEGLTRLELLRGVLLAELGRRKEASDAFARVHALQPQLTALDPAKYRPALVELFRLAGARGRAELSVNASPEGAEVWLDGSPWSVPQKLRPVATGPHLLQWTGPESRPQGRWVSLVAAARMELQENLVPKSDAERLRALRAQWRGLPPQQDLLRICTLAHVDSLLLLRSGAGGVEWSAYTASEPIEPRWRSGPVELTPPPFLPPPAGATATASPSPPRVGAGTPWYTNGWVIGAGAAVLAGTATAVYLLTRPPTYQLGPWCVDGACP